MIRSSSIRAAAAAVHSCRDVTVGRHNFSILQAKLKIVQTFIRSLWRGTVLGKRIMSDEMNRNQGILFPRGNDFLYWFLIPAVQ